MSPRWEHGIPKEGDVLVVKVTGVRFLVTCIDSAEEGWIDIIELDNQCKPSRICPRDLHYYENEGPITDLLGKPARRVEGASRPMKKDDARKIERIISNTTNNYCTCGGCGPDDPKACVACQMYHDLICGFVIHFDTDVRNWSLMEEIP